MSPNNHIHRLSVAPMMTHTDRHFRNFLRLISRKVVLYTEMLTTGAIIHGRQFHRLAYDPSEHPLVLQLGGSEPADLAHCAMIAAEQGYDEINLNVGCPSDRVRDGRFGACLMAEPELVAECVAAMRAAVAIPVTVKTRTGIDRLDSYEHLHRFVSTIREAGCGHVIVHARKAWLQGLSPRQNREIPPLNYPTVYRLKTDFPDLAITINGGITTLDETRSHLEHVDGVMIGRAICDNPWLLATVDSEIYGSSTALPTHAAVLEAYMEYMEYQLGQGVSLHQMTRHILGLFQSRPGARRWRRYLSEHATLPGQGPDILLAALDAMNRAA